MKEIVSRLTENRQIELAKEILESSGYKVYKEESREPFNVVFKDPIATKDNFDKVSQGFSGDVSTPAIDVGLRTYANTDDVVDSIWEDASKIYSFKDVSDVSEAIERVLDNWVRSSDYENLDIESLENMCTLFNSALSKFDYVLGTSFSSAYNMNAEDYIY